MFRRGRTGASGYLLTDRVAPVQQASSAFEAHLPALLGVNPLVEWMDRSRLVYFPTYPTVMGLIDGAERMTPPTG